jgi:hypothetical protein
LSAALLLTALSTIQLVEPLDEPERYCLDVSGWGANLKPDDPVQAHTCKGATGEDQNFFFDGERIVFADSGRCLEVASTRTPLPGAALMIRQCSDSTMQKFVFADNGQISVANTRLCLAVGSESAEAFGPSHVWRVLSLQNCGAIERELSRWERHE